MHVQRDPVGERENSKNGSDDWIGDSGATFDMTRSADLLRDLQPSEDEVMIGSDASIDVDGYGSFTAIFPQQGRRNNSKD